MCSEFIFKNCRKKNYLIFFGIGELAAIKHLVIEGYDHIVDVHDDETIVNIAFSRGHDELGKYLESIPNFEVSISEKNLISSVEFCMR